MKTPPFLLGATLLFWGWQTGFLWVGAVLGVALEASRFVKARWDFSDEDFSRLWIFCSVLFLGTAVYAFTANEGPSKIGAWLQSGSTAGADRASSETAASLFRWLPMVFFLFVAAQAYSSRLEIPLTVVSHILRRRLKNAKAGQSLLSIPGVNTAYPYFAICLFAASNHRGENSHYYWGLCVLLTWVLWTQRTRRFGFWVWLSALITAVALGYGSQRGIGKLQNYLTSLNPEWLMNMLRPGQFDPMESETAFGKIGRIKASGTIVIRLEPVNGHAPNYLRVASYCEFKGRRWTVGDLRKDFFTVQESDRTWVLLPGKTNTALVKITSYLEGWSKENKMPTGLLPLPEGCSRIENLPSIAILSTNGAGAVLAEGPGLVIFNARFGPGLTIDAPFNPAESLGTNSVPPGLPPDLNVSTNEKPALAQVISELGIKDKSVEEKLRAVNGFFQDKFTYSTWQEPPKKSQSPVSRFLLETRSGHCEYFATATVLLLRELGIPARYAVGYVVHETSGKGYVVRQRDAHAWCIVWDERAKLWRTFDTTPASWVKEESKQASPMRWLSDLWSWGKLQFYKFRWGQSNLRQYLLWLLVPVLVLLLFQIIFRRKKRHGKGSGAKAGTPDDWPGRDSEFYLVERKLAERGVARLPNEPLSIWLERATKEATLAEIKEPLRKLLVLHYRCRFDPRGLTAEDRAALKQEAKKLLAALEPV